MKPKTGEIYIKNVLKHFKDSKTCDALIESLNAGSMVLEEVSVEMMTDPAQIWMECKSALFRSTSIFLSQSTDPQRHLADDMRHYSSCLSRILLENQGAQSTCRRVLHYFQQIFNIYAIIFEHGPENLIVRPQMDKHTFGHRLVEANDRIGF